MSYCYYYNLKKFYYPVIEVILFCFYYTDYFVLFLHYKN